MPPSDHSDDDRKVKDVLDAGTMSDLERWFGLPSYTELEEKGIPVEDPDVAAVRERREKAIAAVDPALLEAHRRRTEPPADLLHLPVDVHVSVERSLAKLDLSMVDRIAVAEPREVEIPEPLKDALKECTPQAILRDLHRPEIDFEKTFEVIDIAAEQKIDIVAAVAEAMATSLKLPPLGALPFREGAEIMNNLRAERRKSWAELFAAKPLPNRRWNEDR